MSADLAAVHRGAAYASTTAADRRALAALGLAPFLGVLVFTAAPPLFPAMAADLAVGLPLLGQVVSAMLLLGAAVSLLVGPLADRYGPRRLLVAGALSAAASLIGSGLAPSLPVLLLAALVGSLAVAALPELSMALAITSYAGSAGRRALGVATAGTAVPALVGIPLLTALAGVAGWRVTLVAAGVGAVAATRAIAAWLPEPGRRPTPVARPVHLLAAYRPLIRHRPTLRLLAALGLRAVGWFGLTTYAGAVLGDELGLPPAAVGAAYALAGGGYVAGGLLAGRLLTHLPARRLVPPLLVVQALLLGLVAGTVLGPFGTVALQPMVGVVGAVGWVGLTTLLTEQTPAGAGTTMALSGALLGLGAAIGGAVGGVLLAAGGNDALALGLSGFVLAAAPLTTGLSRLPEARS